MTPALHIGGNETRTRDPDLGKVVLYQLSYSRNMDCLEAVLMIGAGNETRTRDPDLGKVVLYQLSYSRIGTSSANILSGKRDSNSRPRPWQGRALPTELFPQNLKTDRTAFGCLSYYCKGEPNYKSRHSNCKGFLSGCSRSLKSWPNC